MLLIGRDLLQAHHVLDQRLGPPGAPYAQKLPLGWVVVGGPGNNEPEGPSEVTVKKTCLSTTDSQSQLFSLQNKTVKDERSLVQQCVLNEEPYSTTSDTATLATLEEHECNTSHNTETLHHHKELTGTYSCPEQSIHSGDGNTETTALSVDSNEEASGATIPSVQHELYGSGILRTRLISSPLES